MVYVKNQRTEQDLATDARDVLRRCQAMTLSALAKQLGVPAQQVQDILSELVSQGYVEQLQPVNRRTPHAEMAVAKPEEDYYRLIRGGDADFAARYVAGGGRYETLHRRWQEHGHPMVNVLKGGA